MISFLSKDVLLDATIHPYNNLEKIHELGPVAYGMWFLDHSENHGKATWSSRGFRSSQECQSSQVSHKKYQLLTMLG